MPFGGVLVLHLRTCLVPGGSALFIFTAIRVLPSGKQFVLCGWEKQRRSRENEQENDEGERRACLKSGLMGRPITHFGQRMGLRGNFFTALYSTITVSVCFEHLGTIAERV